MIFMIWHVVEPSKKTLRGNHGTIEDDTELQNMSHFFQCSGISKGITILRRPDARCDRDYGGQERFKIGKKRGGDGSPSRPIKTKADGSESRPYLVKRNRVMLKNPHPDPHHRTGDTSQRPNDPHFPQAFPATNA